jgi:hypothetical protein
MRLVILFATLAVALPFIISGVATPFGNAVSGRFLERPTHDGTPRYTVPLETPAGDPLDAATLANWVRQNDGFAKGYATRVIPLGILYLFFLGGFLAIASTALVHLMRWPTTVCGLPAWIWWILPAIYVVCDFAEDGMIFALLQWPSTIKESTVDVLAFLRAIKIATVTLSMVQALLLCLASYLPISH